MRTLGTWALASALLLTAQTGWAQGSGKYPACERTPSDGEVSAAKGAFQAGQASFDEADYGRAITYWEDAYRRDCTAHAMLLNLARAYELNGQKQEALSALETFRERRPGSGQDSQIKRRIDKLQEQIQQEQSAQPTEGGGETATTTTATPEQGTVPPPGEPPPPTADSADTGKRPLLPLIVAGTGGLIAIVGGILYLDASSDVSSFRDDCPNDRCPTTTQTEDANAARSRATVTSIVTLAGLGIGVGGLVWYFLSEPEPSPAAVRPKPLITPALGPDYAGLSVDGRF